jgi:hypothetical protein
MKRRYLVGTVWEAKCNGRIYQIDYDGRRFNYSITKEDGSEWSDRNFSQHFGSWVTYGLTASYCRQLYYDDLKFKKVKQKINVK